MPAECGPYWRKLAADSTRLGLRSHVVPSKDITLILGQKVHGKNLLVAWTSADDPMLASQYADAWMHPLASEKVFCIRVVHFMTPELRATLANLNPYEGYILDVKPWLSIGVFGDRMRVLPFIAPHCGWSSYLTHNPKGSDASSSAGSDGSQATLEDFTTLQDAVSENKELIVKFESKIKELNGEPLVSNDLRRWNRACVTFPNMDGSSIRDLILESKLEWSLNLETLSPCRWPMAQKFDWLSEQGLTASQLRGSLLVAVNLLSSTEFWNALNHATAKIREIQG